MSRWIFFFNFIQAPSSSLRTSFIFVHRRKVALSAFDGSPAGKYISSGNWPAARVIDVRLEISSGSWLSSKTMQNDYKFLEACHFVILIS
jgi:hypothetical protein